MVAILYLNIFGAPNFQARYSLKYDHSCGALLLKMTDDVVCLQFKSDVAQVTTFFFLRVALTGPRSVAIDRLHPCSHWPLFAIAPTHEWIGIISFNTEIFWRRLKYFILNIRVNRTLWMPMEEWQVTTLYITLSLVQWESEIRPFKIWKHLKSGLFEDGISHSPVFNRYCYCFSYCFQCLANL